MTVQQFIRSGFTKVFISLLMMAQLVACGGGGGSDSSDGSSTTISWTAPVARADGSPMSLAEIGGYRVYYGTTEGNYPNRIDIADGSAEGVTLTDLPPGGYYFVVTTYDTYGRESEYSSVVSKTI